MPNISVFGNIYDTVVKSEVSIEAYLQEVKDGRWEDEVHAIRTRKTDKEKDALKRGTDRVTFSGIFSKRDDSGLLQHSGYIAIDLDDLDDPEIVKKMLSQDRYVYACWRSAGGKGLTLLFFIQASKHREAFLGISNYLLENYGQVADSNFISVSKPVGVSFDPNIYISDRDVPLFTKYLKEKKVEKITNFAFAEDDFQKLLKDITIRGIDICPEYDRWLKVGFAFADKFGESGREYFHIVSQQNEKYNRKRVDSQYNYCLKGKKLKVASISTFYFYCKDAGLQITSERTAKVRKTTLNSKAAGLSEKTIIENLEKFEGITGADDLVKQIFNGAADIGEGDSVIEQLELFISANYSIQRNVIKRFLEMGNRQLEQRDLNSMFISAKKTISNCDYQLFERLLMSDFVKNYNPIHEFLQSFPEKRVMEEDGEFISPVIDKLASSIINDIAPFTEYFFRKWIVSAISAIHGKHSPLMFILSGPRQGTGKTEWFRQLLPEQLMDYYAESKLDAGKDDEILMTQKWFVMDDEMSGKSKREDKRLKELTSKQVFSLREPYGKINVDLTRIAVLCGTSNMKELLHDTTGNRRLIIVPVDSIDHDIYNSVDKSELFREAYWLWKKGFNWRVLGDDISYLRQYESEFEAVVLERELIIKYYTKNGAVELISSTEIKVELENLTHQKLSLDMIGKQMSRIGFEKKKVRDKERNNESVYKWIVKKINRSNEYYPSGDKENPF